MISIKRVLILTVVLGGSMACCFWLMLLGVPIDYIRFLWPLTLLGIVVWRVRQSMKSETTTEVVTPQQAQEPVTQPRRTQALTRILNNCLTDVGLQPIRNGRDINFSHKKLIFFETDTYVRRKKSIEATDIVIGSRNISIHQYSTDSREPYREQTYTTLESFLKAYVGQRIDWLTTETLAADKDLLAGFELGRKPGAESDYLQQVVKRSSQIKQDLEAKLNASIKRIPIALHTTIIGG